MMMDLFFWIFRNMFEAGMELPSRSLWWIPSMLIGFVAVYIGWPYAAAYQSTAKLLEYTGWKALMYVVFLVALCRVWISKIKK